MRIPSSTPAPGPKLASLPSTPSSEWLLDNGYAHECGMRPWYDCEACGSAGHGRACDAHRVPGIGVMATPGPQEIAYVDNVGHAPPHHAPGSAADVQWSWRKRKGGATAREVAA